MAETVKNLIRNNQTDLQYGFTKGVDYKSCTVLRETATEYQRQEEKTTYILAADVKNAFSRTNRICQLYELWRSGSRLALFMYNQATYKNTFTVVRNGTEYSVIIMEDQGSKQGGKLSAGDFVAYNGSWSRIIEASNIGLKVEGEQLGGFVCADDSLSCQTTIAELLAIGVIYEFFANEYDVEFAFSKTILNVIGNNEAKELLMKEKIFSLGGHQPLFEKESLHLGIVMTEDLEEVDKVNVDLRLVCNPRNKR